MKPVRKKILKVKKYRKKSKKVWKIDENFQENWLNFEIPNTRYKISKLQH